MTEQTQVIVTIVAIGVGLLINYAIIKGAVKSALRDHHEWVAEQDPPT